ncbi:MAG: CCA tRNA nucleotidyltransferase [Actinobacteria bacterium]|nr:CCA tRNA nucleotidyltransferase [Actinomycetota bacterium]MSW24356.1 CCA tRNA nucleotidyltransferase [Actinomycetota bacterium]MSX29520.1 CCA tRNA nucleotidyltransferase [Actinomycetota bacterium]MSX42668.1 CCA tRNA nucleotidyltransferase [Actinomycetota bacterium]MSX97137.1 CCA tRNA nucleotidyltransferase [Actinomycetota bacterium]
MSDVMELANEFSRSGYEFAVVGGPVRDLLLSRSITDLDFTTNATPQQIIELVTPWADTVWDVGIAFGTVGARRKDFQVEITTYRSEIYRDDSRKPKVIFGKTLEEDLIRRDFTINAMAVRLPELVFVDPFGGVSDLLKKIIRTPREPELSFSDDPLRMMRAARFASQLGFTPVVDVLLAATDMAQRIEIVSAERVRDEFTKLIMGEFPIIGLEILEGTKLAEHIIPELPALQLEIDEHHKHKDVYEHSLIVLQQAIDLETTHEPKCEPDLVLRLAALLHDIGKPKTRRFESGGGVSFHHHEVVGAKIARKRLTAMRYPGDLIDAVCKLTELHLRFHGYGQGQWTDSAVRRYVRDADDQLVRLHKLTRADCTTRNQRRAAILSATYDDLEQRISVLEEQEELKAIRPDLDGNDIMEILGVSAGPKVGKAYNYLLEVRLDEGPLPRDEAIRKLTQWWQSQS